MTHAQRELLITPSSYMYTFSWCFCLVFQRDYHTADSVHITAANSTSLNLDVNIYTRLELEKSIVAPTAQLTIVAEWLQLELIITTNLDKRISSPADRKEHIRDACGTG